MNVLACLCDLTKYISPPRNITRSVSLRIHSPGWNNWLPVGQYNLPQKTSETVDKKAGSSCLTIWTC